MFYLLVVFSQMDVYFFGTKMTSSVGYAYYYLTISFSCLCIFVSVDVYLICMALQMQQLFRRFGHITGYHAEIFVCVVYSVFVGYLIFFYISTPVLVFLINTSDYKCSEGVMYFYSVM